MNQPFRAANYYPLIDVVRFLAALSVLLFHLGYSSWQERSSALIIVENAYSIPHGLVYWFGWVGVQIFFVISGFVIANSAAHSTPLHFLKGRMVRLYPAAWVCTIVSALVAITFSLYGNSELIERILKSLTLLPKGPWIEGVYWTLALEIFFYSLIFLLIIFRKINKIAIFAHCLTVYSAVFILIVLLSREGILAIESIEQFRTGIAKKLLMWHGVFFTTGLYFWLWSQRRLTTAGYAFFCLAISACCLQIFLGVQSPDALGIALSPTEIELRDWRYPVLFFMLCIMVIPASISIKKININPPNLFYFVCKKLGAATYPLYLVHFSLGIVITKELVNSGISPAPAFYLAAVATISLSLFICSYLEPPLKRVLSAYLDYIIDKFKTKFSFDS